MGFIRSQEERMTIQFLMRRYQKMGIEMPSDSELQKQASKIVDEAHHIARQRGSHIITIIKESIADFFKKE